MGRGPPGGGERLSRTTITGTTSSQIAKDQLLMQNGQVSGVKWIFSPNSFGEVGPSGPLADMLDAAGIEQEQMGP